MASIWGQFQLSFWQIVDLIVVTGGVLSFSQLVGTGTLVVSNKQKTI